MSIERLGPQLEGKRKFSLRSSPVFTQNNIGLEHATRERRYDLLQFDFPPPVFVSAVPVAENLDCE
jgi:hypothetical protein